jgi:cellulose synthase/poly-beta-1,6-N-acetylglucosamine synthase-like glycosyltransferase
MTELLVLIIFWLSLGTVVYIYVGYPVLVFGLGQLFPRRRVQQLESQPPAVTVVLAAYNEGPRISARLENLLASDYPKDKLDIIVVSDGSSDATVERARALGKSRIRVLDEPQRSGKAHCLNVAIAAATGELIIFADTRQRFAPDTIAKLVKRFNDPQVGAVSGALVIESAATSVGGGVDAYWKFERFLRFAESQWCSSIGCTGAVYAIRRCLFQSLPSDTILDDVVIPMQIAIQGYRVTFEPSALAYDPQPLEPQREAIRKPRTLAGNYQMLFRYPIWLLPWSNRLWWQLVSHKYLRLVAPVFLLGLFAANAFLLDLLAYRVTFLAQCLFYLLAACGMLLPSVKRWIFSIPVGFVFLNWMAVSGLWYYLREPALSSWETAPTGRKAA